MALRLKATNQEQAQALLELRRRGVEVDEAGDTFTPYRFNPVGYIEEFLGWTPWGTAGTGQVGILHEYTLSLRKQHERYEYQQGNLTADELQYWQVGEQIQNVISVDAGHNVGKTKVGSAIISHFFDCCAPSIIYCFAPSNEQINDLLFKELRTDRGNNPDLPGRVLDGVPAIKYKGNHFVKGKATDNNKGRGTTKIQGQHNDYLMFVLDEAEGIPKYVWDAVDSMLSADTPVIVLSLRNPETTTCEAHKWRKKARTKALRISCLDHPNVVTGKQIVPGVSRSWVAEKLDEWTNEVDKHNPDKYTVQIPWRDNKIYQYHNVLFLWRVLGIPGKDEGQMVFCPVGRYEAALARDEPLTAIDEDEYFASIGVDCARGGVDNGTVYSKAFGVVRRVKEISSADTWAYIRTIKEECHILAGKGITHISIRVDGGGGYGGGIVDTLRADAELKEWFEEVIVHEVQFNARPKTLKARREYDNLITELYADTAEQLHELALVDVPDILEVDLTGRLYEYVLRKRREVKVLEKKVKFKERNGGRSPDDGDGCVLAVASERCFKHAGMDAG